MVQGIRKEYKDYKFMDYESNIEFVNKEIIYIILTLKKLYAIIIKYQ